MGNIKVQVQVKEKTKLDSTTFEPSATFGYEQWAMVYVGELELRIDSPEAYNRFMRELRKLSGHFNPMPVGPNDYAFIPEESDFPVSRENVGHNED